MYDGICSNFMCAAKVEEVRDDLPKYETFLDNNSGFVFTQQFFEEYELRLMRFFHFKIMLPTIPHYT